MSGIGKLKALLDYAKGNALCHGAFAITYGFLTIFFGDELWNLGHVYESAKGVPQAPESWGIFALASGATILYGATTGKQKLVRLGCVLFSAWCFVFAILFAWDCISQRTPLGLPGFVNYFYTSLLVVHRGVLSQRLTDERDIQKRV